VLRGFQICLCGCVLILGAGCARSAQVPLRGVKPLHVNEAGESTPVNVRIYQLKRSERFAAASVEEVWTDAAKVLGDDLVGDPTVVAVLPGTADAAPSVIDLGTVAQGVEAVGVLGLFRKPGVQDQRKLVVTLDELSDTVVECSGYGLRTVAR
jgi:type VI secretion system VasD/TssJ family lipoprotein